MLVIRAIVAGADVALVTVVTSYLVDVQWGADDLSPEEAGLLSEGIHQLVLIHVEKVSRHLQI